MKRKKIMLLFSVLILSIVTFTMVYAEVGDSIYGYHFISNSSGYRIVSPDGSTTTLDSLLNENIYKYTINQVVSKMKVTNAVDAYTKGAGYSLDINVGLSGENIDFWELSSITEASITAALARAIVPTALTVSDVRSLSYSDQDGGEVGFDANKNVVSGSKGYDLSFGFRVPNSTDLVKVHIPTLWYENYTVVDTGRTVTHYETQTFEGVSVSVAVEYPVYQVQYTYYSIDKNKPYFNAMITGVTKAKEIVLKAIAVGSVGGSVSIYNVYAEAATPLGDPAEGGSSLLLTMTGGTRYFSDLQNNVGATNLKFSLDSFLNPTFGILDYTEIPSSISGWEAFSTRVKVVTEGSEGSINIVPHLTFLDYVKSDTVVKSAIRPVSGIVLTPANSDKAVEVVTNGMTLKSTNMVSYMMRMGVPSVFTKTPSNKYGLLLKDGQSSSGEAVYGVDIIEDVYLGVHDMRFYRKTAEETGGYTFVDIGSIKDYGDISPFKLALYQSVDPTDATKVVGTVLQLKVREGVYHNNALLVTGREVEWGGTYSVSLDLNVANESVFKASTVSMGDKALKPIEFAFKIGTTHTNVADHTPFSADTPQAIMYHYVFIDGTSADTNNKKGIVMVRNNAYLNNADLKEWVESSKVKGFLTPDEVASILTLMKGVFELDNAPLTYKEFARFKEIRGTLERMKTDSLLGTIRVGSIVLGILLVVYATFLILFYWFDILNPFTNFQLLSFATFGRLYAVNGKDYEQYIEVSSDKEYVGIFKMAQLWVLSVLLGAVFINLEIILGVIIYIYNTINNLT